PAGEALSAQFDVSPVGADLAHQQDNPGLALTQGGDFAVVFKDSTAAGDGLMGRVFRHVNDGQKAFEHNLAPTIASLTRPGAAVPGQALVFKGVAEDPDNEARGVTPKDAGLTYLWEVRDGQGQLVASARGTDRAFRFPPAAAGGYTVKLTVTDAD